MNHCKANNFTSIQITVQYFVILLTALTFSACAPRPQDCARADVFCVGLITASGSIEDGINREAWLGLQDAKAENSRLIALTTAKPSTRATANKILPSSRSEAMM
ncbi:MAG: hypothetical protein M1282_01080 [Chloroflexi bacterium]|nr:hypothetical protein [Chloroflexota bacterium]